jgi:hypothetical protein
MGFKQTGDSLDKKAGRRSKTRANLRFPEAHKNMPLRKAVEDLREVTLAAISGQWLKLLYFAKLRLRSGGKYSHWGFENRHGSQAEPAMRQAHASVYREVLRTRIPELLEDCVENQVGSDLLSGNSVQAMVPENPEEGESHFHYVVASVQALLKRQRQS